jgi:hypothetical protein
MVSAAGAVELNVALSDGISGDPSTGKTSRARGSSVAYHFELVAGYRDLEVRIDGTVAPASGTIRMDTTHDVRVSAFPAAPASNSIPGREIDALYAGPDPVAAQRILAKHAGEAVMRGDTALLRAYASAEAAALENIGVSGMIRVATALAGRDVLILGDSVRTARARMSAPTGALSTFPADTLVPTSFIFVNGALTFTFDATVGSAMEFSRALPDAGFSLAQFLKDPASARQSTPIRVLVHYNPVVSLQNPLAECLTTIIWAYTAANGVTASGDSPSLWLRMEALLDKARRIKSTCTDPSMLSTNLRALDQYLTANANLLIPPNSDDRALVSLIESERVTNGGRNVVVVGHSQGALIARTALAGTASGGANVGCRGALSVASPLSSAVPWTGADALASVIAKGTAEGSADILYGLGLPRTDGQPSGLTARLDQDISESWWPGMPRVWRRLQLHFFQESYLDSHGQGHRQVVVQLARQVYDALADKCRGTLEGAVGDLATQRPIGGATVEARINGVARGSAVTTGSDGKFRTTPLRPVLHDLVISAPGYETVTLSQRLVPFRTGAFAQGGLILLGRACTTVGGCSMQGAYSVRYQLSGTIQSIPVACEFLSSVRITQVGNSFQGTVTTDRYQQGCDSGLGGYVYWDAGTTTLSGTQAGSDIELTHAAEPPWKMSGHIFQGGFSTIEPIWKISDPHFVLRVELVATRVSTIGATALSEVGKESKGPRVAIIP